MFACLLLEICAMQSILMKMLSCPTINFPLHRKSFLFFGCTKVWKRAKSLTFFISHRQKADKSSSNAPKMKTLSTAAIFTFKH